MIPCPARTDTSGRGVAAAVQSLMIMLSVLVGGICALAGSANAQTGLSVSPAPGEIPPATYYDSYALDFSATGGVGSYSYALISGPHWLSLSPQGHLSSDRTTPLSSGDFGFTIEISDEAGTSTTFDYVINIAHRVFIIPDRVLPSAVVGEPYTFELETREGVGPFTFAPLYIPDWLSLDQDGMLSGIPDAASSRSDLIFEVTDGDGRVFRFQRIISVHEEASEIVLSPAARTPLATAYAGEHYEQRFEATGGTAPYDYQVISGLVMPLRLDREEGVISGMPVEKDTTNVSILVTDANGFSTTASYPLRIENNPYVTMIPPPGALPDASVGANYAQRLHLSDDTGADLPYIYAVTSDIPGIETWGKSVHGVPTQAGTYNLSVQVRTNPESRYLGVYNYTLTVNEADYTVDLSPEAGALEPGMAGVPYSATVTASGGEPPYRYAIESGFLGNGLSLDPDTGEFSGEPYYAATLDFVVIATDANDYTARVPYSIVVEARPDTEPITVFPTERRLPRPVVGEPYDVQISASGGQEPYTFSIEGTLPPGLNFDPASARITGTATQSMNGSFILYARDAINNFGWKSYAIAPREQLTIVEPAAGQLPPGEVAQPYRLEIEVAGGDGNSEVSIESGALPQGLELTNYSGINARIAGTPTEYGEFSFSLKIADFSVQHDFDYTLSIAPRPLIVSAPAQGRVGVEYDQTLAVGNAEGALDFSLESGALPEGLSFDALTGRIRGTPTSAGTSNLEILVTDEGGGMARARIDLIILAREAIELIPPPGALSDAQTGYPYAVTIAARPGPWEEVELTLTGDLPAGLDFDAATGTISGRPVEAGMFTFTVDALAAEYGEGSATYSLLVTDPEIALAPSAGALPGARENLTMDPIRFEVSGAPTGIYQLEFAGALPPGLSWNGDMGTLSGLPSAEGEYSFSIVVKRDADGATVKTVSYSLSVGAPPTLDVAISGNAGFVGTWFSAELSASGGTAPYTFTTHELPTGLSLSDTHIVGTPTEEGSYAITVLATDANGNTSTLETTLTFDPELAPLEVVTPSGPLPDAMVNEPYNFEIVVEGGSRPYAFAAVLPDGLTIDAVTGALSGTPTAAIEESLVRVVLADALGNFAMQSFTMTVLEQALSVRDRQITVSPDGAPPPIDLTEGATGGPFNSAVLVSIKPSGAGAVRIEEDVTGTPLAMRGLGTLAAPKTFTLHFEPDPDFYGVARIEYQLTSALGISGVGTVTYSVLLDRDKVRERFDAAAQPAIARRQEMLMSMLELPTLATRRAGMSASRPLNAELSGGGAGIHMGFSTSLTQLGAAARNNDPYQHALNPTPDSVALDVWMEGSAVLSEPTGQNGHWNRFALVSAGMDYLVNDRLLVGLSVHGDSSVQTKGDSSLNGHGYLYGPYISAEIASGVYLDGHLLFGQSWNTIAVEDFSGLLETERLMLGLDLSGAWNNGPLTVVPKLSISHNRETAGDYVVSDTISSVLADGFESELTRFGVGARISYQIDLEQNLSLTPQLGFDLGAQYRNSGQGTTYGKLDLGLALAAPSWRLEGNVGILDGGAVTARVGLTGHF